MQALPLNQFVACARRQLLKVMRECMLLAEGRCVWGRCG